MKIKGLIQRTGVFIGLTAILFAVPQLQVAAEGYDGYSWTFEGESTVDNKVYKSDGTRVMPTTQINYHVGGMDGLVVTTPFQDMCDMLGLTAEDVYNTARPVLYVAPADDGANAITVIEAAADTLNGTTLHNLNIQFFKFDTSSFVPVKNTSEPLTLVVGLEDRERDSTSDYGMIQLLNGVASIIYDTDTDPATITFQTTSFEGTYVVFKYPKGTTVAAEVTTDTTATVDATTEESVAIEDDEYDDVPKTGETVSVEFVMGLISAGLLTGGILLQILAKNKKEI